METNFCIVFLEMSVAGLSCHLQQKGLDYLTYLTLNQYLRKTEVKRLIFYPLHLCIR